MEVAGGYLAYELGWEQSVLISADRAFMFNSPSMGGEGGIEGGLKKLIYFFLPRDGPNPKTQIPLLGKVGGWM